MKVVLATHNQHKIKEFKYLLGKVIPELELIDLSSFPPEISDVELKETGTTYEENSLIKSETISKLTGLPALGDDSGFEVEALADAPGVFSARYFLDRDDPEIENISDNQDVKNCHYILQDMEDVEGCDDREASFTCVLSLSIPGKESIIAEGYWFGQVPVEINGEGFGYEPIFIPNSTNKTVNELTLEEKCENSHRYKAVKKLRTLLEIEKLV